MPISNVFAIAIALNTLRSGSPGLGIPLIAATGITTEIPAGELRAVTSTDELEDLGFENTDPVWLAFEEMVGQDDVQNGDSPESVYIGSRAAPVAQVRQVDVAAGPHTGNMTVTINGVACTFAASGSNAGAVRDGLITAINGSSQAAFVTAAIVDADSLSVTSDQAGRPFSISVSTSPAGLSLGTATANVGFYDDLDDFSDYVRTNSLTPFYGITELSRLDAAGIEGARWADANNNTFHFQSDDSGIPVEATTTDIFSQLRALQHARTTGLYKSNDTHYAAEAMFGKCLPKEPGTYNPAWQTLGITADILTVTQVNGIKSKRGNWIEEIGGDSTYFEGRTFSGTFIDLIVDRDDLDLSIQSDLANLLKSEDIVPLDEPERLGARIEATIRGKAYVIPSSVVVTVPSYAEIPDADKSNRNVPGIKFTAIVRQGINTAEINGELTL